jgi:hypothetical protein
MALMRQASTCQSERSSDSLPPRLRVKSNAPLPPPLSIPKVFSPETHPHSVSECCGIGLLAVGMGLRPAKLHEKLPLRRRCPPGTDETAMDFRRLLPEIRWQSRLSPVCGTGSPDWFFDPVLPSAARTLLPPHLDVKVASAGFPIPFHHDAVVA